VLDAEDIVSGLLRGAISGRGKPWRRTRRAFDGGSLINARTILTAAGVAWGLYETWQQQQRAPRTPAGVPPLPAGAAASLSPAPPAVADESGLPPSVLKLMQLMISAARADGEIGPAERERILAEAREVGAFEVVEREILVRRPLGEIVAGVDDPELKEQLYALAYTIVRVDATVTGGEQIYLAQLASQLGLDADSVKRIQADVARRIEAAAANA
jgi:uncharacterized membrane protein YebE (DUF533 family)